MSKTTIRITEYQLRIIQRMAGENGTDSEGLANIINIAKYNPAFEKICADCVGPNVTPYHKRPNFSERWG